MQNDIDNARYYIQIWASIDKYIRNKWENEKSKKNLLIVASICYIFGIVASSFLSLIGLGKLEHNMNQTETLYYTISPAIFTNSITFSSLVLTLLTFPHFASLLPKHYQDEIQRDLAIIALMSGIYNFIVLYQAQQDYVRPDIFFFVFGIAVGTSNFLVFKPNDKFSYAVTIICLTATHSYGAYFYYGNQLLNDITWIIVSCGLISLHKIFSPMLWELLSGCIRVSGNAKTN